MQELAFSCLNSLQNSQLLSSFMLEYTSHSFHFLSLLGSFLGPWRETDFLFFWHWWNFSHQSSYSLIQGSACIYPLLVSFEKNVLHTFLRDNSACVGSWVYIGPHGCKKNSSGYQVSGPGTEWPTLLECCLIHNWWRLWGGGCFLMFSLRERGRMIIFSTYLSSTTTDLLFGIGCFFQRT